MRLRLWIAVLFMFAAPARAQAPNPSPAPQTPGAARQTQPIPTEAQIFARLQALSAGVRTLTAAPGHAIAVTGPVRGGALIAALPVRYQTVGYLERPLVRDRPLGPSRVVLGSGAPVFATRFASNDPAQRVIEAWCGVGAEDGRPTGFCLLAMRAGPQVAEPTRIGSPYMPREIASWYPTDTVPVREDERAQAAMPAMEITYSFTEFDTHDADVMTGVRVAGGAIEFELQSQPAARSRWLSNDPYWRRCAQASSRRNAA